MLAACDRVAPTSNGFGSIRNQSTSGTSAPLFYRTNHFCDPDKAIGRVGVSADDNSINLEYSHPGPDLVDTPGSS